MNPSPASLGKSLSLKETPYTRASSELPGGAVGAWISPSAHAVLVRGRVGLRAAGRRVPTSVVWSVLNAATYSRCVHGTALPTSAPARRAVPRCVYRRTHRARFPRRFGGWRGVCVCGQNQVFRGRRARSLRAISSRDWPADIAGLVLSVAIRYRVLWRFDIAPNFCLPSRRYRSNCEQ